MRTAQQVLAELEVRGVELNGANGRIRFRPIARVDAELRGDLQRLKSELLALLDPPWGEKNGETALTPTDSADTSPDAQASVSNGTTGVGPFADFSSIGTAANLAKNGEKALRGTDITDSGTGSVLIDGGWYTPGAAELYRASVPFMAPSDECRCCGGVRRWRLNAATPWVCARCHPSGRPVADLERTFGDPPAPTFEKDPPSGASAPVAPSTPDGEAHHA